MAERARYIVSLFYLDLSYQLMYRYKRGGCAPSCRCRVLDEGVGLFGGRNDKCYSSEHVPSTLICPVATDQRARFDILRFVPWIDECERPKGAIVNIIVTNME